MHKAKEVTVTSNFEMSVVVLTHNSFTGKSGCVRHVLSALSGQQNVRFDVVVVDNGSSPHNRRQLRQTCQMMASRCLSIQLLEVDLSIGSARNAGAKLAQSAILVFLDDDAMLLDPHALTHVKRVAETSSFGYAARRLWTLCHPWFGNHQDVVLGHLNAGAFQKVAELCGPPQVSIESERIFYERSYIGHFGFVRRSLFLKVGGFPELFTGYGCEDDALGLLLYLEDPRFGWLGEISVAHVDHARPQSYIGEHAKNRVRYGQFLSDHGVREFHTDVLLAGRRATPQQPVIVLLGM